jgi:hypothetical protein
MGLTSKVGGVQPKGSFLSYSVCNQYGHPFRIKIRFNLEGVSAPSTSSGQDFVEGRDLSISLGTGYLEPPTGCQDVDPVRSLAHPAFTGQTGKRVCKGRYSFDRTQGEAGAG